MASKPPSPIIHKVSDKEVNEKRDSYRELAIDAFDAVYDSERAEFLFAGRHALAIGSPTVLRVPLEAMLMTMAQVIATNVAPMIASNRRSSAVTKKAD